MGPNEELCLCFHVTRRKVANYIRLERPQRAAQLADCYGAGTGCGWCRPFLERMFQAAKQDEALTAELPSSEDYARQRSKYVQEGGGTPPAGATPITDQ